MEAKFKVGQEFWYNGQCVITACYISDIDEKIFYRFRAYDTGYLSDWIWEEGLIQGMEATLWKC